MLFANPVDPSQTVRIHYQSPAGPASAYPRTDENGLDGTLKLLAAAALLATGYVIGGFAVASVPTPAPVPVEVDGGIGGPVSKVGGGQDVNLDPVPGEFRLGPGNLEAPGIAAPVVKAVSLDPVPGEFRLGPGNNEAPGVVVKIALPVATPNGFQLSPGNLPPVGFAGR